jgi:hypothetical protein
MPRTTSMGSKAKYSSMSLCAMLSLKSVFEWNDLSLLGPRNLETGAGVAKKNRKKREKSDLHNVAFIVIHCKRGLTCIPVGAGHSQALGSVRRSE